MIGQPTHVMLDGTQVGELFRPGTHRPSQQARELERGQRVVDQGGADAAVDALPMEAAESRAWQDRPAAKMRQRLDALTTYAGPALAAPLHELLIDLEREVDDAVASARFDRHSTEQYRRDLFGASELVARMHAAAIGEVAAPRRGVVEDVRWLRSALVRVLVLGLDDTLNPDGLRRLVVDTARLGLGHVLEDGSGGIGGEAPGDGATQVAEAVARMQAAVAPTVAAEQREEQQRTDAVDDAAAAAAGTDEDGAAPC